MTLIIETAKGVKFTSNEAQTQQDGFAGIATKTAQGILLSDKNGKPQAHLSLWSRQFNTAYECEKSGALRFLSGLTPAAARFLGYATSHGKDRDNLERCAHSLLVAHFGSAAVYA